MCLLFLLLPIDTRCCFAEPGSLAGQLIAAGAGAVVVVAAAVVAAVLLAHSTCSKLNLKLILAKYIRTI